MKKDDWIMFLVLLLGACMIAWASIAFYSMWASDGKTAVKYD